MNFALILLVLSILFPTNLVFASWNAPAMAKIKAINENYKHLRSGDMLTAWGGWKRMNLVPPSLKGKFLTFKTPETKTGHVKAYLHVHPGTRPVPFFIYFPGIFGDLGDKITDDFVSKLESIDAHVLVIPNFLSDNWVRFGPLYDRHPAKTEILLISAIWKEVSKLIPLNHMTGMHIIGESLGSLLATAFSAQAELSQHHPSTLTLLWPPAKLDLAMENLDVYLENSHKNTCSDFLAFPLFMGYFLIPETPAGISEDHAKCLGAWGAQKGFVKNLDKITDTLVQLSAGRPFRSKNFRHFFENMYKPLWKIIEEKDESLDLSFWLKTIKDKKPNVNLRILTSYDDFLNKGLSLPEVIRRAGYGQDSIFVFDWGGHGGPIGTKEFVEILYAEFFVPKDN